MGELEGVNEVVVGYSGGKTENPTCRQVCNGDTGVLRFCRCTSIGVKFLAGH